LQVSFFDSWRFLFLTMFYFVSSYSRRLLKSNTLLPNLLFLLFSYQGSRNRKLVWMVPFRQSSSPSTLHVHWCCIGAIEPLTHDPSATRTTEALILRYQAIILIVSTVTFFPQASRHRKFTKARRIQEKVVCLSKFSTFFFRDMFYVHFSFVWCSVYGSIVLHYIFVVVLFWKRCKF
jgi:hypothetical protein